MKIAILDQENIRVIVADVPSYLMDANAPSDDIASAIMTALGLSSNNEYMIGNFGVCDLTSIHSAGLAGLTQDFKEDALEVLKDLTS